MSKCIMCKEEEKVGYKYCKDCKKLAASLSDVLRQRKRRIAKLKPCQECKETLTNTKYCNPCAQKVHAKQNKTRIRKSRKREGYLCEKCKIKPKWSTDRSTMYCAECRDEIKLERIKKANEENKRGRHFKKVALNPNDQQPTIKAPKKKKDSGINPYFLERGTQYTYDSGYTQFNQE